MVRARFILKALATPAILLPRRFSLAFRNTTVYCILDAIGSCPMAATLQKVALHGVISLREETADAVDEEPDLELLNEPK